MTGNGKKNPHEMNIEQYGPDCRLCHPADPVGSQLPPLISAGMENICQSCHPIIPLSCKMAATKKVTDILLEQIPHLLLRIKEGSLACESCHGVHGGAVVRTSYSLFLKQAENINPHRSGIFCIFCHDKEPIRETDPLNLKFGGDGIQVCTQCHNNVRARADNHPVNLYPSEGKGVKLDERFPLYDGKVTCLTCHKIPCKGEETKPKFLRGGPYKERVDACLECHQKESYKAINPHDQIDEFGRLRKDRCLYCHIIEPPPQ